MASSSVNIQPLQVNEVSYSRRNDSDDINGSLESAVEPDIHSDNIDSDRTEESRQASETIEMYSNPPNIGDSNRASAKQLIGYFKPTSNPSLEDLNIAMRILYWLCALCILSAMGIAAKMIPASGATWEELCFAIQTVSFAAQICFFVLSCIRECAYGIPLFLPLRTYCIITEIIEASMCLIGHFVYPEYTRDKFKTARLIFAIILCVLALSNFVWALLIRYQVFANYTDSHSQFILQAHKYQAISLVGQLVVPYAPRSKLLILTKHQKRVMRYCSRYSVEHLVSLYGATPGVICINELRGLVGETLKTGQCGTGFWCITNGDLCIRLVSIINRLEKLEGKETVIGKGPYTVKHPNEFVAFPV